VFLEWLRVTDPSVSTKSQLLVSLHVRDGAVAGGFGSAWASAVWLFQISEHDCRDNRGGGPARAGPVWVSPEKPLLARDATRP
jgi:hypothetical protein